ncbi:MAG: DEAD/DEAH box helicase [Synechococcales cyanobacterium CRU_2_2]|nr:DEAD/DEAH box helicase [Synechococcales cyanobacterium CRU_2_2]
MLHNSLATIDGYPLNTKLREQLVQAYERCSAIERQFIQLLAVLYEPVNRQLILMCLDRLKITAPNGNHFTLPILSVCLNPLLVNKLVIQERTQGPRCHPLLREVALRDTIAAGSFEAIAHTVTQVRPVKQHWSKQGDNYESEAQFIRDIRIALYAGDLAWLESCEQSFQANYPYKTKISVDQIVCEVCNNPFDSEWLSTLPAEIQARALRSLLTTALNQCEPAHETFELLQNLCEDPESDEINADLACLYIEQLLIRGDWEAAQQVMSWLDEDCLDRLGAFQGWVSLLEGDVEGAIAAYRIALKADLQKRNKRKGFFQSLCGSLFILALLKEGSAASLRQAIAYTQPLVTPDKHWLWSVFEPLQTWASIQQGNLSLKPRLLASLQGHNSARHPLGTLIHALCVYWVQPDATTQLLYVLESFYTDLKASGYYWLAMEAAELLARLTPESTYALQAEILRQDSSIRPLVDLIQVQEAWELQLQALTNLCQSTATGDTPRTPERRLVWLITYHNRVNWHIQPTEQKINAKGVWSSGRNVALKRLSQVPEEFDYLTPQDLRVCQHIQRDYYSYRTSEQYSFASRALLALVGHPLVFWADNSVRLEILKGEPELRVLQDQDQRLTIEFSPEPHESQSLIAVKESPTRLKLIETTEEHRQIARILGNQLKVPVAAQARVLEAIQAVSQIVTVQSDIGGGNQNLESVSSVATPHFHLLPAGEGLKVALLCRPFGTTGPYYHPGKGGQLVIADLEGSRKQTERDLSAEKKLAKAAIAACPTLKDYKAKSGEWQLEDPEDCLELLIELQALGEQAIVEWPEGEKLRIRHQVGLENLHLNIGQQKDWFAVSGEIQVDDEEVLQIQQLLALLEHAPSRFVPLGNGQFLALTQAFRKRMDELRAFSETHGKGIRFHPLASLALEEMMAEVGSVKADRQWKAHLKKLNEVKTLEPKLPSTLQAELRDYQKEGFEWLARLAHWGVGACLADDMGLGKTIQALALILTRAPQGPTLVVAPTSVGINWISEAQKFAPTLNPILLSTNTAGSRQGAESKGLQGDSFGSLRSNRQATLDNLQPFDLLVCTYGLLQQPEVATMLAAVAWETIVLDEAQAIKNSATKRSQAAMKLQAGFKLIATGTPIENHLGELWNQFRFINPGLLGSQEQFNQRFAVPIERNQDKAVRHQLRTLIQPFILRRTKNQVLEELPSRTEITLTVELSPEERALYEALRREAIAKLSDSDAEAGTKHLQILAEITKLRRLCCNAKLVVPDAPLPSAKLQVFGEVLEELLENRHKALVFSQFVDHLRILRDYLDTQKISYQYLDGSTPTPQRKQRVDAFQAGEGDVFLISLKAGGTGLNLTAADYVIHMDPWWNPAVEDQASDRAHRIGQQRPVTIYRLVAQGTIEEKIVELHRQKRDLADSLLEGTDSSGKLSSDQLLRLIRND